MVVYLDLIIIENFLMNFLILYTTGRILEKKITIWRICVASLIGVLYTFSLYINLPSIVINVSKIVVAILLVIISFNSKKVKTIVKESIVFLVISFIYAGCSLAFVYFCKPKVIYIVNGVIIGGKYIFEITVASAILSLLLIKVSSKIVKIKNQLRKKDMICDLSIVNNGNSTRIKAMIDTGNMLVDPVSKDSVIVVDYETCKELFTKEEVAEISSLMENCLPDIENLNSKFRIIPYSSLGNNKGLMVVYRTDCIEVSYADEVKKIEHVLIGFSKECLSKNGQYKALIGLGIIERGNYYHESSTDFKDKGKCSVC